MIQPPCFLGQLLDSPGILCMSWVVTFDAISRVQLHILPDALDVWGLLGGCRGTKGFREMGGRGEVAVAVEGTGYP